MSGVLFINHKELLCGGGSRFAKLRLVRALLEGVWCWTAGALHWGRDDLQVLNSLQARVLRLAFGVSRRKEEDWATYNARKASERSEHGWRRTPLKDGAPKCFDFSTRCLVTGCEEGKALTNAWLPVCFDGGTCAGGGVNSRLSVAAATHASFMPTTLKEMLQKFLASTGRLPYTTVKGGKTC